MARLKEKTKRKLPKGKLKLPGRGKLKTSSGAKYVLFMGEEGTVLVYIKDNVVHSRQYVPDASDAHLKELRASLAEDPKAPLLLAVDSMDQSYIQQTLPPVSSLSVKKLVKRRLDRDFGVNDIKGAIILGRDKSGRRDWNFLMVALERSPQLTVWLDFIKSLPNRFQGIYLVSVEAEIVVKNLDKALGLPKEGKDSEWKFFVSHNKVGGFRQVILKNGRIVFTRMAQPVGESAPDVIAGNIEQEMLSTIEYMRRLSFDPASGLDIYIIASGAIKDAIDRNKFRATNMNIFTPYEVAQYLGIEGATQPSDQFGDVILAASIGCSKKHVLTLYTPESQRFDNLYRAFIMQRMLGATAAAGILLYMGSIGFDIYSAYANSGDLEQKKRTQQAGLDKLREEIKATNLDVEATDDMIDLYKQLQHERLSPLSFIAKVETVIKPPIVVKSIAWSVEPKAAGAAGANAAPAPAQAAPHAMPGMSGAGMAGGAAATGEEPTAVLSLEFPGIVTLDAFRVVSKKILDDLKLQFKGYDIAYTKLPTAFSESEKLEMTFNDNKPETTSNGGSKSTEVQLTIKPGTGTPAGGAPGMPGGMAMPPGGPHP